VVYERPRNQEELGMFGKGRLLREGAKVSGVVVESVAHMGSSGGMGRGGMAGIEGGRHIANDYRVKVRVTFDDGSTTETSARLRRDEVGSLIEGATVPVRYDPTDHSKVEIDVPALKAEKEAGVRAAPSPAKDVESVMADLSATISRVSAATADAQSPLADMSATVKRLSAATGGLSDTIAAIQAARAAGDLAEVERLKAEFQSRAQQNAAAARQAAGQTAPNDGASDQR
jgi:hypothetical protein